MVDFNQKLIDLLKTERRFLDREGDLLKSAVINQAFKVDAKLIELLLEDAALKQKFFSEIKGHWVFDVSLFVAFIQDKNFLNDSYTQFKNKIGLTIDGKHLNERNEVVLAWPYKDCVLEGGMSDEESKRDELFFNEVLAQDEIDRLFDPKVLTNGKRFDQNGVQQFEGFTRDANGVITDNLIIKGNNLLALHSLKKEFHGKVKLIYIDPPYNTGNDGFRYNDRFNHSTWLTFMKNRLEVARDLLRDDGSIFVNIDDKEYSYLSILLDEVFGKENFISLVTVSRSAATGHKTINPSPINVADYVISYAKSKGQWKYRPQYTERNFDTAYSRFIENIDSPYKDWKIITLKQALDKFNCTIDKLLETKAENIIRFAEPSYTGVGKETRALIDESKKNQKKIFTQERESYDDIYLLKGQRILFYKNKIKEIDGKLVTAEPLTNMWTDIPFQGIAKEGGVVLLKGKKPEKLIKRIFDISTEERDLVLDFFAGSGTTAAVAHKMGRQYIGVEQMDYINEVTVPRLQKVIAGEQGGISKSIEWQGGGSFIYFELKKYNEAFIEQIQGAEGTAELETIWEAMKAKSFLNWNVDFRNADLAFEAWQQLDLAKQKEALIELLNKNQLYVNLTEMEDEDYACTQEEKNLSKGFYNL